MGINIDGARDLVSAGDGSLTIEGFSINSTGIGTFTGGIKIGTAASMFSNGNITAGIVTATEFVVGSAVTIGRTNGNATFAGIVTATSFVTGGGNINLGDSGGTSDDRITLGAGPDMQLYHNGTDSVITNATGDLYINNNGGSSDDIIIKASDDIYIQPQDGESGISVIGNGAVELYYDSVKEFSTKSGGVKLWGHSEQAVNALGNSTGTVTIDFTTANIITATLTGTTTFANPTTESVGQSGSIVLTQDGTGSRTASWGSQFKWVGGTAPTLTTTAAAVDRIDYLVVAADTIHCVASLDVK